MVVEAGHHVLPDGTVYDAQAVTLNGDWTEVEFYGQVQDAVVFSTINSDDNNQPMVTRHQEIDTTGLQIRMQAEMAVTVPGSEVVGILAVSQGQGDNAMIVVDSGVNEEMKNFGYPNDFQQGESGEPDRPFLFAAMQSFNGPATATLRVGNVQDGGFEIKVEEEGSAGEQGNHADETLGYMALWNDAFQCDEECQNGQDS
jgi:hypothetical protein